MRIPFFIPHSAFRTPHFCPIVSLRELCEAKIQQNDLSPGSEFQVLRFDIAVNDLRVLRMQIIERIKQLVRPGEHLARRKWSACSDPCLTSLKTRRCPRLMCIARSRACRETEY